MAWKHVILGALAIPVMLAPSISPAQQLEDIQKEGAMSREERIKAHRAKIEKIIEENKRKREAELQQARQAAQPGANAGDQPPAPPGQPLQPGAVTPGSATPGQPTPPGAAPANVAGGPIIQATPPQPVPGQPGPAGQKAPDGPQGARSESRSMVFLYPFDTTVNVGETFETELVADTKSGAAERVAFCLKYPKDVLNPLAVDHSLLDAVADKEIEFAYDPEKGEIYLAADFKKPLNLAGRPLAKVTWEAISPSDGSQIRFSFESQERSTGLFHKGVNVLGTNAAASDGVLNSTVMIRNTKSQTFVQEVGQKGLLIAPSDVAPPEPSISLSLAPSRKSLRAGEEFYVDVVMSNPRKAPLDKVSLYLQFDPRVLEVVDHDRGNVIRNGINMHEAVEEEPLPFDFHRANGADNELGTVEFFAGSTRPITASGVIGRIYFRARTHTDRTDVVLVRNAPGYEPTTEVSYLDKSMLKDAPATLAALTGVSVSVAPGSPLRPASQPSMASSPAQSNGRGVILSSSGLRKNRQL